MVQFAENHVISGRKHVKSQGERGRAFYSNANPTNQRPLTLMEHQPNYSWLFLCRKSYSQENMGRKRLLYSVTTWEMAFLSTNSGYSIYLCCLLEQE